MKLESIEKLLISSILFIIVFIFILLIYHRLRYYKSNYGKFEYYLTGESKMADILIFSDMIFQFIFCVGVVILFGHFISLIIF